MESLDSTVAFKMLLQLDVAMSLASQSAKRQLANGRQDLFWI
jgi:hypothetical protein